MAGISGYWFTLNQYLLRTLRDNCRRLRLSEIGLANCWTTVRECVSYTDTACHDLRMSRRTKPASQRDDDAFPIRIKLKVPPEGLGRLANDIPAWLHANLERGSFATHSARTIGGSAMAIYFVRIEDAARFLNAHPEVELAKPARGLVS